MSLRLMVTGSRTWDDPDFIRTVLVRWWNATGASSTTTLVVGGAKGADHVAAHVWRCLGLPVEVYPAAWSVEGKGAGLRRNLRMLDTQPDQVIAFCQDRSKGTMHAVEHARRRGIDVVLYEHFTLPGDQA